MRNDILNHKEDILRWIEEGMPKAYICKQLRCKFETLNSYLEKMGITYKGNQGCKSVGIAGYKRNNYVPVINYLYAGSTTNSYTIRLKLIKEGIREAKCEECGTVYWNDKPVPLELHHMNGDRFDNRLENLQILCPNCHAQTYNNSGKNVGNYG